MDSYRQIENAQFWFASISITRYPVTESLHIYNWKFREKQQVYFSR